jgi:hypothetical protein
MQKPSFILREPVLALEQSPTRQKCAFVTLSVNTAVTVDGDPDGSGMVRACTAGQVYLVFQCDLETRGERRAAASA